MPKRERTTRKTGGRHTLRDTTVEKDSRQEQRDKTDAAEVEAGLDDLLDEIDDLLEQNAEQFVKDYVQRGGE